MSEYSHVSKQETKELLESLQKALERIKTGDFTFHSTGDLFIFGWKPKNAEPWIVVSRIEKEYYFDEEIKAWKDEL